MEWPLLAIVEIYFPGGTLPDASAAAVETVLRTDGNVGNLSLHSDKMIFFIWSKDKIDYSILDKVRDTLKKIPSPEFVISANEYRKSEEKYNDKTVP